MDCEVYKRRLAYTYSVKQLQVLSLKYWCIKRETEELNLYALVCVPYISDESLFT